MLRLIPVIGCCVGISGIGFTIPSLFLLSGAIVLLFLLLLGGAYDRTPLNEIFFLQADTDNIPNAPSGVCHWTLYNVSSPLASSPHPLPPVRHFLGKKKVKKSKT